MMPVLISICRPKEKAPNSPVIIMEHDFDVIMEDGSGIIHFAIRHTERAPWAYKKDIFVEQPENMTGGKSVSGKLVGSKVHRMLCITEKFHQYLIKTVYYTLV
jgi:hypothetical protein